MTHLKGESVMIPNHQKVTKNKTENDKKDAVDWVEAEYLLITESLKGNFSCRGLRGTTKQLTQEEDGSSVWKTKRTTLAIRLYMDGYMFDIPVGITDYLRKERSYHYIPSYKTTDGYQYIDVTEVQLNDKSEKAVCISDLTRFGYKGKHYISEQSLTIEGSRYLIDCYHRKCKFEIAQYTDIITTAEPYPLVSSAQLKLEQEFFHLQKGGTIDTNSNSFSSPKEPEEDIESQNPSHILNFSLASCPALAVAKIQNIDHILDFIGSGSNFDLRDLELIRPIYNELQELKSMFAALLLALKAQPVDAQQPTPEDIEPNLQPTNQPRYTYTIPPLVTTKSGQLKKTQVYIYDADTNAFMVKALTLFEHYNKTLSEEKAGKKTLDELKSKYASLYNYFIEKNKEHKKVKEYKISWFTLRGWFKTHFEIKDSRAVKQEKKKD